MIKYRAAYGRIVPIEVAGETAKFVILTNGRREAKTGVGCYWRDTFEEAKQAMLECRIRELRNQEIHLKAAMEEVAKVEAMEEGR